MKEQTENIIESKTKVLHLPMMKYLTIKITKSMHQFYLQEKQMMKSPEFINSLKAKGMSITLIRRTSGRFGPHKWDYETLPGPHAPRKSKRISMIRIRDLDLYTDRWYWEIYAYEDRRLFEDVKQFNKSRAEVEKIIFDYLKGKEMDNED